MPPEYILPAELAQALYDYLARRPYLEVAGLIQAMAELKPREAAVGADPARPADAAREAP
jgi:hypothetical protein